MTKLEIIECVAKEKWVEEIINGIKASKEEDEDNLKDLVQDTYMELLLKDASHIERMWEDGCLRWFITRMLVNSIQSKTSRYYYKYKKDLKNKVELNDNTYEAS